MIWENVGRFDGKIYVFCWWVFSFLLNVFDWYNVYKFYVNENEIIELFKLFVEGWFLVLFCKCDWVLLF